MKKLLLLLLCTSASASPYFRLLDPQHPKPVLGALIDPASPKQSEGASLLPLITHSPKDGCIIPGFCETWTPLAIGASINAGQATFAIAPLFNAMPWARKAVEATTTIRFVEEPSVEISAGPVWEYKQATNKGYFRVFTGLALCF